MVGMEVMCPPASPSFSFASGHPQLARRCHEEVAPDQVRCRPVGWVVAGRADASSPADVCDSSGLHQPSHALLCDGDALGLQLGMHPGSAIGAPRSSMDRPDPTEQVLLCRCPRGRWTASPGIVARCRDPQNAGHRPDGEVGTGIALMKRYTRNGSPWHPERTRRSAGKPSTGCLSGRLTLCQDIALLAGAGVLAPKLGQLLALNAGRTIMPPAFVAVRLAHPVPDRLRRRLELLASAPQACAPPALAQPSAAEPKTGEAKLRRTGPSKSSHVTPPNPSSGCPPKRANSTSITRRRAVACHTRAALPLCFAAPATDMLAQSKSMP